jgi:hypothetical protein
MASKSENLFWLTFYTALFGFVLVCGVWFVIHAITKLIIRYAKLHTPTDKN